MGMASFGSIMILIEGNQVDNIEASEEWDRYIIKSSIPEMASLVRGSVVSRFYLPFAVNTVIAISMDPILYKKWR